MSPSSRSRFIRSTICFIVIVCNSRDLHLTSKIKWKIFRRYNLDYSNYLVLYILDYIVFAYFILVVPDDGDQSRISTVFNLCIFIRE